MGILCVTVGDIPLYIQHYADILKTEKSNACTHRENLLTDNYTQSSLQKEVHMNGYTNISYIRPSIDG